MSNVTKESLEKIKNGVDVPIIALHKKVLPTNFVFSLKEKCLPCDASRFATLRPIPEMYLTEPMALASSSLLCDSEL